jgi:hypothetical protein
MDICRFSNPLTLPAIRFADNDPRGTAQRSIAMVRNFLLRLFAAMYESRQRHAALVIERHAHLVGEAADYKARRGERLHRHSVTETLERWTLAT